ncbi:MAG TPA: GNAT family N-acetyltransferase, partial [Magnetospirillum sp.]|nr:GNAT family N-acetyltransferase [Magnetospirillum sp.]
MTHLPSSLAVTAAPESAEIEVRLATSRHDVEAAQRLRYRVFYQEMGAQPCVHTLLTGRDEDRFDAVCDHLLAVANGEVVGTYRLITARAAALAGGFYSAGEFDISPLLARGGN